MRPAARALVGLWAVVLLALGGGAAVLQWLGPPTGMRRHVPTAPPPVAPSGPPPIPPGDPALLRPAADFPDRFLPVTAPDGRTPAGRYRAPAPPGPSVSRVAVLLEDLGLDDDASATAVSALPPAVSLAVSPYAAMLAHRPPAMLLDRARERGHELWLSLPMEPAAAPGREDDEGDWALRRSADVVANGRALEWSLSRFTGYVGVTDANGALFGEGFADDPTFAMVSDAVRQRGLLYLEAGAGPHDRSALPPPGSSRHAELVVDGRADAAAIDDQLATLDRLAAAEGGVVAVAGPVTGTLVERLRLWSDHLKQHGLLLVPVSALVPATARPATPASTAEPPTEGAHAP